MAMPRICVCAAPDTPTAQRSEFMELIEGATAVGGGDFTVVSLVALVVLVDVLVLCVIIGSVCATATDARIDIVTPAQNFL
jgi:hypothetical protein